MVGRDGGRGKISGDGGGEGGEWRVCKVRGWEGGGRRWH